MIKAPRIERMALGLTPFAAVGAALPVIASAGLTVDRSGALTPLSGVEVCALDPAPTPRAAR